MHAAVTAESSPAWPAPGRAGVRFASCGLSSALEVILRARTSERYPPIGGTAAVRRGRASGDARVGGTSPAGQRHWHFANVPRRGLVQATVPPQSCAATATHHPSRREQGMTHERSSPVIMTKLVAPRLGRGIIDRPRLFKLVSTAQSARLIVITAPAGFGNTSFAAAWLAQPHTAGDRTASP